MYMHSAWTQTTMWGEGPGSGGLEEGAKGGGGGWETSVIVSTIKKSV